MKNILVAINFDDCAKVLIDEATELAGKNGSKLWIVHIAEIIPDFVGFEVGAQYIRNISEEELNNEQKMLESFVKPLIDKGINAEGILVQGATAEMILEESLTLKTDLIVLGHHEHNVLYNIFVGNIYSEIVKKSTVPVLVVPFR